MRRRYTKREQMAAVAEAEVTSVAQASDKTGIPESSIRYWMDHPRFVELRAKTRDDLLEGFGLLAHLAQSELARRIGEMEPRDLTILLGVATDKKLLLSGEATGRTETVHPSLPPEVQRDLRERFSEIARLRAGGEEPTVEDASEARPASA